MAYDINSEKKSYVGMAQCFLCGEPKHLLLDRRLKATLPYMACYDKEPCDKCRGYMKKGIIFVGVKDQTDKDNPYRTGGYWVIKEEAVKEMPMNPQLLEQILKKRVCFIEDTMAERLGLKRLLKKEKN